MHLKCTVQYFLAVFMELRKHHHNLSLEHSPHPKEMLYFRSFKFLPLNVFIIIENQSIKTETFDLCHCGKALHCVQNKPQVHSRVFIFSFY